MAVYLDGFDSHSFNAYHYNIDKYPEYTFIKEEDNLRTFKIVDGDNTHWVVEGDSKLDNLPGSAKVIEVSNTQHNVGLMEDFKKKYSADRSASKSVTFAMQYAGTWLTLMKNCGYSEEQAKAIEANYHNLFQVSKHYTAERIQKEAVERGYASVAFGLKLRTPLLKKSILGNRYTSNEAKGEARTVGNAISQSFGMLNNRAINAFMQKVWNSEYRYKILPVALIHDAIYLIIEDDIDVVKFVNDFLIEEMSWQELPELQHDKIKLGAELDIFAGWHQPVTLSNNLSKSEIISQFDKGLAKHYEKLKKEA